MTWFIPAAASAVLSAAAAILQKKVLDRLSAPAFTFVVSVVIAAGSLALPGVTEVRHLDERSHAILALKSVLSGAAFYCVMAGLRRNQISRALPLLGLSPAVTAVCSWLFLGEGLTASEWLGVVCMMAGVLLVERRPDSGSRAGSSDHAGTGYLAAALLLYAVSSVMDRLLVGSMRISPSVVLAYQHIVFCFLFGAVLAWKGESPGGALRRAFPSMLPILAVAALTIAYRFLQLEATREAPVALVLAVKRSSILVASLFGGRLFADDRLAPRVAGCAMIVAAGFLILRSAS